MTRRNWVKNQKRICKNLLVLKVYSAVRFMKNPPGLMINVDLMPKGMSAKEIIRIYQETGMLIAVYDRPREERFPC